MKWYFRSKKLSAHVKLFIEKHSLSFREAEKKLKVSSSTLCRIVNNKCFVDVPTFLNLCTHLGTQPNDYFEKLNPEFANELIKVDYV